MKAAKLFLVSLLFLLSTSAVTGQNKLSFYSSNSLGYLTLDNSSLSLQTVNGIALNKQFHFGLGLGLEVYDSRSYLPLFFETRINLIKQAKTTPFLSGMAGKCFSVFPQTSYGGLTTGIHAGLSHFFSSQIGISFSVGYRYVHLSNSYGFGDIILPVVYTKNLLDLRIGFIIR